MTNRDGIETPSAYDADAATRGLTDRGAIWLDANGEPRAEEIVVDARFAGGPFVVDTSTSGYPDGSHRVVVLGVPGLGDIDLFPHEAIDLARALLARARFALSDLDPTGA